MAKTIDQEMAELHERFRRKSWFLSIGKDSPQDTTIHLYVKTKQDELSVLKTTHPVAIHVIGDLTTT